MKGNLIYTFETAKKMYEKQNFAAVSNAKVLMKLIGMETK